MADYQKSAEDVPQFAEMNNLSCGEGVRILFAMDDWFAAAENLTKREEPVFKDGLFTQEGKWMDGWETRRKRIPGHDWCVIQLAMPAIIHGVDFDTAFFTGNYVPRASLQAALLSEQELAQFPVRTEAQGQAADSSQLSKVLVLGTERWTPLTAISRLRPGYKQTHHNYVPVAERAVFNVVRLNIYPDGGMARLRVFGHAHRDWSRVDPSQEIDLALASNGGVCVAYSNAHYGHPRNLIAAGRGVTMADGWETARRLDRPAVLEEDERGVLRVSGQEWAILRLCRRGTVTAVEVDTCHFKGNFPDAVRLDGCHVEAAAEACLDTHHDWTPILLPQKLRAHDQHKYSGGDILPHQPVTYVRVTMSPDGGISRLRLHGHVTAA